MATKKTAAKKKAAPKKTAAKKKAVTVDVEAAPAYTAWTPADMPIGGKSNSTEMLNDHPTEHNHAASAVSDIVDRFADLRLYVPGVNSCGIAGDLQVDGNANVAKRVVASHGSTSVPSYAFASNTKTGVTGHPDGDRIYNVIDGVWKTIVYGSYFRVADDLQVEGQTKAQNGTQAKPAYSFTSDTNTGTYRPAADALELVVGGERAAYFGKSTNSTTGVFMPGINSHVAGPGAAPIVMVESVSNGGTLIRTTSARRHISEVESVNLAASNSVYDLKPVWYRSKSAITDPAHSFYGFVAEDVAAVDPRLVAYSSGDGGTATPETVNDHAVLALLVSAVQEQRQQISDLTARIEALEAAG